MKTRHLKMGALLFLFLLNLYACQPPQNKSSKMYPYPLTWYQPLTGLPLQKQPNQTNTKNSLYKLRDGEWFNNSDYYGSIDIFDYKSKKKVTTIRSCNDYLSKNIKGAEPKYNKSYFLYMQFFLTCEAVNITLHGENSTVSYIGKFTLNRALADKLPIELAFAVSPDSHDVVKENKGKSWTFFDTIKGLKKMSPYVTQYKIEDATQTISLLARGDFNHDHQEDVLLLIGNDITDGRYDPTRLFTLTRDKGATLFRVVKQYQLRSNVDE